MVEGIYQDVAKIVYNKLFLKGSFIMNRFKAIDHIQLAAPKGCEDSARKFFRLWNLFKNGIPKG
jgi:hypothetical protein